MPDSPVEGSAPLQNCSSFDESITQPPSESRRHASAKPAEDVDAATADGRDSTSCAKDGARSEAAGDKNRYLLLSAILLHLFKIFKCLVRVIVKIVCSYSLVDCRYTRKWVISRLPMSHVSW